MSRPPLTGVRVLDLSTILAAPLAAGLLAEYGAEVVKVEQPGTGDPARSYPPLDADGVSAGWSVIGSNRRSVTLDLHHPRAAGLVGALVADCDVVVTNFRPPTLRRFGIDFDDLVAHRADLVMLHVSAYGRTGPYAGRPGFARVAESFAGLTHRTGHPDHPPVLAGYPVADGVTGMYAAFATLLALRQRDLTGEPQLVDLALYEPLLRMMEDQVADFDVTGESPGRHGNANPHISPNNLYRTRDDRWLALPASTERMWQRLVGVLGAEDLAAYDTMSARLDHRDEIEDRVARLVADHDLEPLVERLVAAGIAAGPVNTAEDLSRDPHVTARGSIVSRPGRDGRPRLVQASAGRFSGFDARDRQPAPRLGEHTDEVLGELGLSPDQIADLRRDGAL